MYLLSFLFFFWKIYYIVCTANYVFTLITIGSGHLVVVYIMFISIEYRYAFVHIPKTAGEWLYLMLRNASRKDDLLSIGFWGQDHRTQIDATHLHQAILYNYISPQLYNDCVSFCVVRNPYNRFYSAFGDLPSKTQYSKSVAHRQPKAERFWIHKYPAYQAPNKTDDLNRSKQLFHTFCALVDHHNITTDTITKHNIHLIPQHCFVYKTDQNAHTCFKNVNHILRFEHLGRDLEKLFNHYHFPHTKHPRKHYSGSYKIRFDTADVERNRTSYLRFYTPQSIAFVNRWYAKDFEYFGFKKLAPAQFETIDKTIISTAHTPSVSSSARSRKSSSHRSTTRYKKHTIVSNTQKKKRRQRTRTGRD